MKDKITLKKYIEENDKLLTALGVFSALTLFFSSQGNNILLVGLSMGALTCAMLIWLELWATFPKEVGSMRLIIFENVLSYSSFALVAYWIIKLHGFWNGTVLYLLYVLILGIISLIFKKTNLFNRVFKAKDNEKKYLRYSLGIIIIIITFVLVSQTIFLIGPTVDIFITSLEKALNRPL